MLILMGAVGVLHAVGARGRGGLVEILIAVVVFAIVSVANIVKAARARKRPGGAAAPPRQTRRPPATPGDEIRGFLSALGVQTEEPQKPRQAEPRPQQPRPAQGSTAYEAGDDQVKSYLQSIGVQVEGRPAQRQGASQQAAGARPAARRRPAAREAPVEAIIVEAVPAAEPPPRAKVVPRKARRRAAPPKPAPAQARARAAATPAATVIRMRGARLGHLGPLGKAPTLAELRRAVILAEVIRRPDFSRLPCERLKF